MQIFVRGQIFVNAGQSDLFCLPHPVQASQCGYIITCQTNTDYQTDSDLGIVYPSPMQKLCTIFHYLIEEFLKKTLEPRF